MCITNLNILLIDVFFLSAAMTSADLTLEEPTEDGDTALTLAAEAGLMANVKMLLLQGASPHSTNGRNESPLLIGRHTHAHKLNTMHTQSLIPYRQLVRKHIYQWITISQKKVSNNFIFTVDH